MDKNVCIVNFNTTELTMAAIKSLLKNTPDCKVTVFDNSDREPFPGMEGVRVIDNTQGQIIDFDDFLSRYPKRRGTANNFGSAKHSYTIDRLFDYFPGGFVLMDSDVLVKGDISEFFDASVIYAGERHEYPSRGIRRPSRLLPFLCWINVPVCRQLGINYFDGKRSWKLFGQKRNMYLYDTGASFLEDCNKAGQFGKAMKLSDYIIHLGSGSWRNNAAADWLEEHKQLYE